MTGQPTGREIQIAKDILTATGHVVLKAKSHRAAQERLRIAQALLEVANEDKLKTISWAQEAWSSERRLADRLTFVYGVARAHGATVDELSGGLV